MVLSSHPPLAVVQACQQAVVSYIRSCASCIAAVQGLAETLLTLDVPGRICGPDMKPGQRVRLAPLGCAMLTTLLSFPQVTATPPSSPHSLYASENICALDVKGSPSLLTRICGQDIRPGQRVRLAPWAVPCSPHFLLFFM